MGFRFSMEHANWVAHLLHSSGPVPPLTHDTEAREALTRLLSTFEHRFFSTRIWRHEARFAAHEILDELRQGRELSPSVLAPLRYFLSGYPWVSLLLPSGTDPETDRLLTSRELLESLVEIRPDDPGLILQLETVPERMLPLSHVFSAFKIALASSNEWPGVLTWTPTGDGVFFPLPRQTSDARESLQWIFSHLAAASGVDLSLLKRQYDRHAPGAVRDRSKTLSLLHLSDVHLGSKVSARRMPRVQQIIRSIVAELGEDTPIVPVVTGDLMDTPDDSHLDALRAFLGFLQNLGVEDPLVTLGNHDVRTDGWLHPDYKNALQVAIRPIVWFDESEVALISFDSVRGGRLARGQIGERQMIDVGNALDQEGRERSRFARVGLLHHHPTPVDRPDWYHQPIWERLMGGAFQATEDLEDARTFLDWAKARQFAALLHGHKHIPRVDATQGIVIVGCGSSVGKVQTPDAGRTYMSVNVVTIDTGTGKISCRLRAERIPGAGLETAETHELLYRDVVHRVAA